MHECSIFKSAKTPKRREADGGSEHRVFPSSCKVAQQKSAWLQNPGRGHPWLMTQKLQVTSIPQSERGRGGGQEDEMPQGHRSPPWTEGRQGWPCPAPHARFLERQQERGECCGAAVTSMLTFSSSAKLLAATAAHNS